MDAERTDVSARKEQRRNDVAVRAHDHAAGRHGETRLVIGLAQQVVVQVFDEQFLDQLRHGPTAAAVGHVDDPVPEIQSHREALDDRAHATDSRDAVSGRRKRP